MDACANSSQDQLVDPNKILSEGCSTTSHENKFYANFLPMMLEKLVTASDLDGLQTNDATKKMAENYLQVFKADLLEQEQTISCLDAKKHIAKMLVNTDGLNNKNKPLIKYYLQLQAIYLAAVHIIDRAIAIEKKFRLISDTYKQQIINHLRVVLEIQIDN